MRHRMTIDSPVGRLVLAQEDDVLVAIGWGGDDSADETPLLAETARQLRLYFAGNLRRFDLPLAPAGTGFEQRVWSAMREIPHGEARSYGELASAIGSGPRAVGRACGRNPIPIVIPCHRVISRSGLGGYSGEGGVDTKRHLLALEGFRVRQAA